MFISSNFNTRLKKNLRIIEVLFEKCYLRIFWCYRGSTVSDTSNFPSDNPTIPLTGSDLKILRRNPDCSLTVPFGRNDAKAETPILWPPHAKSWLIGKDFDAGRVLGAGEEGDDRRWDGWMASLTQWTWVWVKSGSWWWTGKPGVLWFMGSQRVRHDWATELNWTI